LTYEQDRLSMSLLEALRRCDSCNSVISEIRGNRKVCVRIGEFDKEG
jgi:hypothetical protein